MPDNSNIRLDLTSIGDSEVNGFAGATLNPLPFTVDVADVEILLGLAFRPVIPVGFEFSNNLKAEIFVSLDLPRLDARLSTDVAASCGGETGESPPFNNATGDAAGDLAAIGPLALVEANVSVTIDAGFSLDLPILPPPFDKIEVEANIFSVGFPLITACVNAGEAMTTMTATVPDMPSNRSASVTTMYNNGTISNSTRTALVSPTLLSLGPTPAPCMAEATTTVYNATMTVYKTIKEGEQISGTATTTKSSSRSSQTTGIEIIKETKSKSRNSTTTATPVVKEPLAPGETLLSALTSTKSKTVAVSSVSGAEDFSFASATPVVTTIRVSSGTAMSTGFLIGANATSTGSLTEFTGAAVPGAEVPGLSLGWQVVAVGLSLVFGAVMVR